MNTDSITGSRSFKPPFLMLVVLGVHVAAAGFFMMMSGCKTRTAASHVEPPPAPLLPPTPVHAEVAERPVMKPVTPVKSGPEEFETVSSSTYVIQKGDSLSRIAARAGVSAREIAELNNIANMDQIRIGQKILLPAHAKSLPSTPPPSKPSRQAAAPASASGNIHVVQGGDTLGKLAKRYGTTVAAFKEVNNLKNDLIRVGQKLGIPSGSAGASAVTPVSTATSTAQAPQAPAPAPAPAPIANIEPSPAASNADEAPTASLPEATLPDVAGGAAPAGGEHFPYSIKDGDTLDVVAVKFGVSKEVIVSLNQLESEELVPGTKLLIPWQ